MHSIRFAASFPLIGLSLAVVINPYESDSETGIHIVTNTKTVYTTICPVTPSCSSASPTSWHADYPWESFSSAWNPSLSGAAVIYDSSSSVLSASVSSSPPQPSSSNFPECWSTCFAENGSPSEVYRCGNKAVSSCICDNCSPSDDKAYKEWLVDFCADPSQSIGPIASSADGYPGGSSSAAVSAYGSSSSSAAPVYGSSSVSAPPVYGSSSSAAPSVSYSSSCSAPSSSSSSAGPRPSCPAVWSTIVEEMKQVFAGCSEPARQSIRFAFHDAAGYSSLTTPYGPASGGADGSLLLNEEEVARRGNAPLPQAQQQLKAQWTRYQDQDVTAADFIQMSGLIAVRSCGGPAYTMLVGREDDSNACPEGTLPAAFGANSSYDVLTQLWGEKGIDERELAALIGAHTVSRAFAQASNGVPPASPQDSTFTKWDNGYFKETQATNAPSGVFRFQSDMNLAMANTTAGQAFTEFGNDFNAWNVAYSAAAYKLSLLGVSQAKIDSMADCSALAV